MCKGKTGGEKKSVKWVAVQTNCSEQDYAETKHFRHRNRVWSQVIMAMTMKTDMLFAQQLSVFLCDTSQAGHRVPVQALAALFSVCWLCHSFCWELHSLCDKITSNLATKCKIKHWVSENVLVINRRAVRYCHFITFECTAFSEDQTSLLFDWIWLYFMLTCPMNFFISFTDGVIILSLLPVIYQRHVATNLTHI